MIDSAIAFMAGAALASFVYGLLWPRQHDLEVCRKLVCESVHTNHDRFLQTVRPAALLGEYNREDHRTVCPGCQWSAPERLYVPMHLTEAEKREITFWAHAKPPTREQS